MSGPPRISVEDSTREIPNCRENIYKRFFSRKNHSENKAFEIILSFELDDVDGQIVCYRKARISGQKLRYFFKVYALKHHERKPVAKIHVYAFFTKT
jgi:hypothetical protein